MNTPSRTLTLHIGTGKTGSTSIQNAIKGLEASNYPCATVSAFGLPNAILLAMSCGNKRAHDFFVSRRNELTTEEFEENAKTIWKNVRDEVEASEATSFVASSEFIYNLIKRDDITLLKAELDKIFDEVYIVAYLREQNSFFRSTWAQNVKGSSKSDMSFSDFIGTLDGKRYKWNYSMFLKRWLNAFGIENMKVGIFDKNALHGGDVVVDFFHKAGVEYVPKESGAKKNVTPSWEELQAIRFENFKRNNPEAADCEFVEERHMDPEDYNQFVLEKVSAGNQWVNKTFFKGASVQLPVLQE